LCGNREEFWPDYDLIVSLKNERNAFDATLKPHEQAGGVTVHVEM